MLGAAKSKARMDPRNIADRFHRAIDKVVQEKFRERMDRLSTGSAADYPDYKEQVGYLQAMRDFTQWCAEIEMDLYGPTPAANEGATDG